jgi:hypothetical protein
MLVPGIVAATLMAAGTAVMSMDSPIGKTALYAFYRWQRRRRSHRAGEPARPKGGFPAAVTR